MDRCSRVLILGNGFIANGFLKRLASLNYEAVNQNSLRNLHKPEELSVFFELIKPEYVILAAPNYRPEKGICGEAMWNNGQVDLTVIEQCLNYNSKLIYFASDEVYPRVPLRSVKARPLNELDLMDGILDPEMSYFGFSKLWGIKICQAFYEQYSLPYTAMVSCEIYNRGEGKIGKIIEKIKDKERIIDFNNFLHINDLVDATILASKEVGIFNVYPQNRLKRAELLDIIKAKAKLTEPISFCEDSKQKVLDTAKIEKLGWRQQQNFYNLCLKKEK